MQFRSTKKTTTLKNKFYLPELTFKTALIMLASAFFLFEACNKSGNLEARKADTGLDNGARTASGNGKPNIIFILGDDIGYDALTSQGNTTFSTPRIDELAQEGMRFTECHSAPLCSPSRTMLVTGKYNFRNYAQWGVLDPSQKTFANLLKDAGYKTYVAGKWQFDGGNAGILGFGYDNYCVWDPVKAAPGNHYKDPKIYTHGSFISSDLTKGLYGDDIFTDSVLQFIDQNKTKPFFIYFPITLCHSPYSPTPDDPEFPTWIPGFDHNDTKFFPSMIKYMDKKIGQVVDSLKAWNLFNNTILIFAGDNGTPKHIFYYWNGVLTEGGKTQTTEKGTHVPLIVTWPNVIAPGQTNNNLVDFTDFLPTFGEAAGASITSSYGTIDGQSFFGQLTGGQYTPRDWIFCDYNRRSKPQDKTTRWTQDVTYKLYDSTNGKKFYNIVLDPQELTPLKTSDLTASEKKIRTKFQNIMDSLH